jgi:hypothetical protein
MAPDEDGGGGGGGTTAAGDGTTTTAQPETPPAGGAPARTFTQAEVDAIVKDRVARANKSAQPSKPANAGGGDEQPLTMKQLAAELAETKLRSAFEKRAAKLNLDDETADELFEVYKAKPPEDPAAWFEKKGKLFAPKSSTNDTTPAPSSTQATKEAQRPAAAPTAPAKVDTPTSGGLVDLWHLSLDQLNALGPEGTRREYEKALAVGGQRAGAPPLPRMPQKNR